MLKTKSVRSIRVALALVCVVCLFLAFSSIIQASPGLTVTFVSATYNSGTNQTTFTYRVTADGEAKGMSHWELEMCTDYYVNGSGQGTGYDPAARVAENIQWDVETSTWTEDGVTITGIKWLDPTGSCSDCTLGDGGATETDQFTFALTGNWENVLGPVAYTTKSASIYTHGFVQGPDCSGTPTAVTLSSFAAESSAGGSVNPLWLGLAGLTLAAGSLFWVKRRAS